MKIKLLLPIILLLVVGVSGQEIGDTSRCNEYYDSLFNEDNQWDNNCWEILFNMPSEGIDYWDWIDKLCVWQRIPDRWTEVVKIDTVYEDENFRKKYSNEIDNSRQIFWTTVNGYHYPIYETYIDGKLWTYKNTWWSTTDTIITYIPKQPLFLDSINIIKLMEIINNG